jgi:hypothetical protein
MFACDSETAILASLMNISTNSGCCASSGRMRLMTTPSRSRTTPWLLALEHLGHAALRDALEQLVLAEQKAQSTPSSSHA